MRTDRLHLMGQQIVNTLGDRHGVAAEQLPRIPVQRAGNLVQRVHGDVGFTAFDFAEVLEAQSCPVRQDLLRESVATPLLPVVQTTATLNWPQAGQLNSVTAPLITLTPVNMSATVPCDVIRAMPPKGGRTDLPDALIKQGVDYMLSLVGH